MASVPRFLKIGAEVLKDVEAIMGFEAFWECIRSPACFEKLKDLVFVSVRLEEDRGIRYAYLNEEAKRLIQDLIA